MAEEETKGEQTERVVLMMVDSESTGADRVTTGSWKEVGRAPGSKRQAIKAVVGDREGVFRAPSLRSWKGAIEQVRPEPTVQARLIED
jgi:hypothetical protein